VIELISSTRRVGEDSGPNLAFRCLNVADHSSQLRLYEDDQRRSDELERVRVSPFKGKCIDQYLLAA
jgi:hypothetical protein